MGQEKESIAPTSQYEFMESVTYLTLKTPMGYEQIMKLPYPIFLAYLKHVQLFELKQTPEGREYLAKIERLQIKEADISGLRQLAGYKQV